MSLNDLVRKTVHNGLNFAVRQKLGGYGTYTHIDDTAVYDKETDTMVGSDVVLTNIPMVRTSLKANEYDWEKVLQTDSKIIISAISLGDIVPKEDDRIEFENIQWEIIRITTPPSSPSYSFIVRKI